MVVMLALIVVPDALEALVVHEAGNVYAHVACA